MKRALNTVIFLYPKAWRDRYESEFRALLDEVAPSWNTFLNVFGGAMRMQFKTGKSWKIVAACALAGVIAGLALTWTIPHRYVSTAVLSMGDIDDAQMNAEATKIMGRAPLTYMMMEADLYRDLRATTPIEEIVEQLKRDIMIRPVRCIPPSPMSGGCTPGGHQFTVSVTAPDAERAQKAVQILAADFLDAKIGTLIDPASLPVSPNGPRLSRNILLGLGTGVLLGSLFALFAGLKVWKLAAGLGIAGAVAGAAIAFAMPERFASSAVLRYDGSSAAMGQVISAATSDANLRGVAETFKLYEGESGAERRLREHLHIEPVGSRAIAIRFDDRDRYMAQKVVADVASRVIDQGVQSRSELALVELLDPASLPLHAYSPKREMVAGAGLFAGLLCAVMFGIWRYYRTPLPAVAAQ